MTQTLMLYQAFQTAADQTFGPGVVETRPNRMEDHFCAFIRDKTRGGHAHVMSFTPLDDLTLVQFEGPELTSGQRAQIASGLQSAPAFDSLKDKTGEPLKIRFASGSSPEEILETVARVWRKGIEPSLRDLGYSF